MKKQLFFSISDNDGEIGCVHYKHFILIYIISVLLFIGAIPLMMLIATGNTATIVTYVSITTIVLIGYIYLWQGGQKEKIFYKNDGTVTIVDNDLYHGKMSFHIKDIYEMEVIVNPKTLRTGMFREDQSRMASSAQLKMTFKNGNIIYWGSATYGGQLKMMKNFLWAKYDKFDANKSNS